MAANLYYTPSTYSSSTTGTFSFWIKRGKLSSEGNTVIWSNTSTNDNNRTYFSINSDDKIRVSVQYSGSDDDNVTNAKFRDTFGWMHIVIRLDSTQGTAANRCVIWVNGEQQSMSSNAGTPSGNITAFQTSLSNSHFWGGIYGSASGLDNAYLTQCVYCDGQAYSASNFGETDSTTGEWKPKTDLSGLTFGNNGYWLKFENSANMGLDSSGNSNNLTNNSNEVLQVADNPSNVFATFNPISGSGTMAGNATFSNGNNTVLCAGSVYNPFGSTIGVNKGKYYAEFKTLNEPGDGMIGIFAKLGASGNYIGSQTHQYSWYRSSGNTGRIRNNSNDIVTGIGGYTTNDIIGIALDCDNNKLYMHKNGTYISNGSGTGDPTNGNYGISITDPDDTDLGFYFMTAMDWGGSGRGNWSANFGNGYFGTTAVATNSGNGYQDVDGNGIFNYTVPTNYRALCTKGLNQ